ncbi:MAG: hypothetical protein HOU81_13800 [Hamadaea sp.]|uniref:hypothetical protein n=1 Tax=Hamadaea sp. TaxID=2024425 RepID=UPI00179C37C6|nr:hypothetical protein [Hamadaea sp.]NUR71892.1 hypothetical protein [Hamadaea sp.]NUT19912.1 hypothetical protein [Hamadaea sp.]
MVFDRANPLHVQDVRLRLSAPRLAPYDVAAAHDHEESLNLYEWNLAVSAACYKSLHAVEVCLRNTINDQLGAFHTRQRLGGSWLDDPTHLLEPHRRSDIAEAASRARRKGYRLSPDRIITELPFGFWRYLTARRYERTLWEKAIRHGFPNLRPQRRRAIAEPLERLHFLRNRIAHHEPVYFRDLAADVEDMRTILAAMSPLTYAWAEAISALPGVLGDRPAIVRIPLPRCP